MTTEVHDNAGSSRYEVLVDGAVAGHLAYRRAGDDLHIPSTVVQPAYRGQGLAALLVRHALDDVRSRGGSVTTTCWYVQDWLAAHPDYRDVLAG